METLRHADAHALAALLLVFSLVVLVVVDTVNRSLGLSRADVDPDVGALLEGVSPSKLRAQQGSPEREPSPAGLALGTTDAAGAVRR